MHIQGLKGRESGFNQGAGTLNTLTLLHKFSLFIGVGFSSLLLGTGHGWAQVSPANEEVTNGFSGGPNSFPSALGYVDGLGGTPDVIFGSGAIGASCVLGTPTTLSSADTINTSGLTNPTLPFIIFAQGLTAFNGYPLGGGGTTWSGTGSLTLSVSGSSGGVAGYGFYNTGTSMINTFSAGGMTMNVNGVQGVAGSGFGYGFYNASPGTMTTTFSGSALNVSATSGFGYGFYNASTGNMDTTLSGSALTVQGIFANAYGFFNNAAGGTMTTNFSNGTMSVAGGRSGGYGFYNNATGNIDTTLSGGTLNVSGNGYGFYNNAGGTMTTNFSSGTVSVLVSNGNGSGYGFYNASTGNMDTTLSGGTMTVQGLLANVSGYGFYNKGRGTMTTNFSSGTMTVTGNINCNSYGFFNQVGGIMAASFSGGTMNVVGGNAYGFVDVGASTTVNITGGTLFVDGGTAALGTTLSFSGGTFSSSANGAFFGGLDPQIGLEFPADLTLSAGATHQVVVGSGSLPVQMMTGSTATLGGATLNVVPSRTLRSLQGTYTIMEAAEPGSSVGGTYGTTYQLNGTPTSAYTVAYGDAASNYAVTVNFSSGFIALTNAYPSSVTTGNGLAMAEYLDAVAPTATGDLALVIDTLDKMLLSGETAEVQAALNQIQPSQLSAQTWVAFYATLVTDTGMTQAQNWVSAATEATEATASGSGGETEGSEMVGSGRLVTFKNLVTRSPTRRGTLAMLQDHSFTPPKRKGVLDIRANFTNSPEQVNRHVEAGRIQVGKANIWVQPYGQLTSQGGNNNGNPNLRVQTGGIVLGADYEVTPNTLVGILGGTSAAPFTWGANRGYGQMNSGFGGVYGAWKEGHGFYVEGQTIFGGNHFSTNRNINFSTISRTASENHNAFQFTGNLEIGYTLPVYEWFTCQPFISSDYLVMRESGYTETGAQSLNMTVKPKTSQFLQGEVGAMVYKTFTVNEVLLRPIAELGWVIRAPLGATSKINGGLISQPSTLGVTGVNKVYNQVAPGLGLIAQFKSGMYVSGNVYGGFGGGLNIGEALVRVGYEF